ncbi:hypothetical protein GWK47_050217 [Chionoecetes opilio]|uniref:Uncharacterized protein n=1 Tax=Chionoecetes opilio TaxID=41210 RepID=A0A8J4Y986_CHIOP|nr:hypothetical protein GWK47_050217 [Chionoecetes opilio]
MVRVPRWGARPTSTGPLLDRSGSRGGSSGQRCRAGTTNFTPFPSSAGLAGLTVMYKVHQQGCLTCTTLRQPYGGPGYHKGRCSSPRRATTAQLPYLAPPASVRLRLRWLVECFPCLAATP